MVKAGPYPLHMGHPWEVRLIQFSQSNLLSENASRQLQERGMRCGTEVGKSDRRPSWLVEGGGRAGTARVGRDG